jgi:uncharacterized protein YbaP (TraB family)
LKKLIFLFICFVFYQATGIAQSLCWKIEGNGLKSPSYIYGTMHLGDKRVIEKANMALPFLKKSKVYAMELDPNKMDMQKIFAALLTSSGQSIKATLTPTEYALLDSLIKAKTNLPISLFDSVQPFVLATLLSIPAVGEADEGEAILDLHFYKIAQAQKIPAVGIESLDEQLDVFTKLSYEEQMIMLRKAMLEENTNENDFDKMINNYLAGNLDSLLQLSNDTTIPKEFADALLNTRNEKMAKRIAALVKSTSYFIAIGALHLPGEMGVLYLLKKEGFKVVPID